MAFPYIEGLVRQAEVAAAREDWRGVRAAFEAIDRAVIEAQAMKHPQHKNGKDSRDVCVCGHSEHSHKHGKTCATCEAEGMRCEAYWAQGEFEEWEARHDGRADVIDRETVEVRR